MERFLIVEKNNHLAIHGRFYNQERAERHLQKNIPTYCRMGFFSDKTLKPDDFEIIEIGANDHDE